MNGNEAIFVPKRGKRGGLEKNQRLSEFPSVPRVHPISLAQKL
jgi:hypothetical protein